MTQSMSVSQTRALQTADGLRISFDHYAVGRREEALIICPGFFKSKETPTFQRLSRALAQERDVITMDFRGHGRSEGLYTFSAKEGLDLAAVLGWARGRYDRIGLLGFSLGGAIAMNTLSRDPEKVRGLIAVSAPSEFKKIEFQWWRPAAIRAGLRGLERGAGCRPGNFFLKKERPLDAIAMLAAMPTLFIHGTHDVIVGVGHGRRLFEAAAEPKELQLIEGGGHAEALFRDDPNGFCRLINRWWLASPAVC